MLIGNGGARARSSIATIKVLELAGWGLAILSSSYPGASLHWLGEHFTSFHGYRN